MVSPNRNGWTVLIERQPQQVLRRLPQDLLQYIDQAILDLPENCRPYDRRKSASHDDVYRIQVEDWHISYAIEDEEKIILILEIAPRESIDRNG